MMCRSIFTYSKFDYLVSAESIPWQPRGTNTAPRGTNTAPRGTNTAPRGTNTAPRGTNTTPRGTNTAPRGTNTAPRGTNTAPRGTNTEPRDNQEKKGGGLSFNATCKLTQMDERLCRYDMRGTRV